MRVKKTTRTEMVKRFERPSAENRRNTSRARERERERERDRERERERKTEHTWRYVESNRQGTIEMENNMDGGMARSVLGQRGREGDTQGELGRKKK